MPKNHIKPTTEELDAKIKKSLESLDASPKEEVPALEKKNEDDKRESKVEPDKTVIETPKEVETPEEPPKEESENKPDYKKKFKSSTAEALVLNGKSQKLIEVIDKANSIPEPTEEEMQKEYSDWEIMSEFERKMAKNDLHSKRKFQALEEGTKEFKDIDKWSQLVDDFIADPENLTSYPDLEGKEEEFKIFATKPTRRGVNFEDLVSSFLFMEGKSEKVKNKGSMFPTGSPGVNERPQPKSDKITLDEARRLRITDYKKYLVYVRSGKIELETL